MYIRVNVVAGAKKEFFSQVSNDRYDISVREPAERNLANRRIREILATELGVSSGKIRLIAGHQSPHKIFSLEMVVQ